MMRHVALALVFSLTLVSVVHAGEPVFRGLSWGDPVTALGDVTPVPLSPLCPLEMSYKMCDAQLFAIDLGKAFINRDVDLTAYDDSIGIAAFVNLDPEPFGSVETHFTLYLIAGGQLVAIRNYVWDRETMEAALRIRYGQPLFESSVEIIWTDGDTQVEWHRHLGIMTLYSPDLWAHYRDLMDEEDARRTEEERRFQEQKAQEAAYSW